MPKSSSPGFLSALQEQLEDFPSWLLASLNRPGGLDIHDVVDLVLHPSDHTVVDPEPVDDSCIVAYDSISKEVEEIGRAALEADQVAFCVLSGAEGPQTGCSQGLLRFPERGTSLLTTKMFQASGLKNVWVMTSPSNHEDIAEHVSQTTLGSRVKFFKQYESFRLTPDNLVFMCNGVDPSLYPCGNGDAVPALRDSGILDDFLTHGGKHVVVTDVDNILASVDPKIVGQHIVSGRCVTCEVVHKTKLDVGGLLCRHMGIDQVVDMSRISPTSDTSNLNWFSTETMVVDASLDFSEVKWSWHRKKKAVDGRLAVQHERYLHDLTEAFKTQFVSVARGGRYMQVKTRQDMISAGSSL